MRFRLLITASRHYTLADVIDRELAGVWWEFACPPDGLLVSGHCPEGDLLCEKSWTSHGYEVEPHPAKWHEHGDDCPTWCRPKRVCVLAGPRRDRFMVGLGANVCLAFIAPCISRKCRRKDLHGSHGATGTADMAQAAGIDTRRILHPDLLRLGETAPTLFS